MGASISVLGVGVLDDALFEAQVSAVEARSAVDAFCSAALPGRRRVLLGEWISPSGVVSYSHGVTDCGALIVEGFGPTRDAAAVDCAEQLRARSQLASAA